MSDGLKGKLSLVDSHSPITCHMSHFAFIIVLHIVTCLFGQGCHGYLDGRDLALWQKSGGERGT